MRKRVNNKEQSNVCVRACIYIEINERQNCQSNKYRTAKSTHLVCVYVYRVYRPENVNYTDYKHPHNGRMFFLLYLPFDDCFITSLSGNWSHYVCCANTTTMPAMGNKHQYEHLYNRTVLRAIWYMPSLAITFTTIF